MGAAAAPLAALTGLRFVAAFAVASLLAALVLVTLVLKYRVEQRVKAS